MSGGQCVAYQGQACADVISWSSTWERDGTVEGPVRNVTEVDERLANTFALMSQALDETCAIDLIKGLCALTYLPCYPGLDVPQSPCKSACDNILDPETGTCKQYVSILKGLVAHIPTCETDEFGISGFGTCANGDGDDAQDVKCVGKNGKSLTRSQFPEAYTGQLMFADTVQYEEHAIPCFDWDNFQEIEVEVNSCYAPNVHSNLYGADPCPNWFSIPLSQGAGADFEMRPGCDKACMLPCPFTYMSTQSEIDALWALYVAIGILALVVCMVPFVSYTVGKATHKIPAPQKVIEMLTLSLVYLCLEVVPSAALATDIQCSSEGNTMTGSGTGLLCTLQRSSVHFLQAVYYLLATMLAELTLKLNRRSYEKPERVMHAVSYIIPICCCIGSYALMSPAPEYPTNYYELWGWNYLKDPFRCTIQVQTNTQEWLLVHGHFVGVGFIIILLASGVIKTALGVSVNAGKNATSKNRRSIVSGMVQHLRKANMTKLVAVCFQVTIIIALQLAVSIDLSQKLDEFSIQLEAWKECSYFATPYSGGIEACDVYKNAAEPPSQAVLRMYMISGPLICLVIGLTFGANKAHVSTYKQLSTGSVVAVNPSSAASLGGSSGIYE